MNHCEVSAVCRHRYSNFQHQPLTLLSSRYEVANFPNNNTQHGIGAFYATRINGQDRGSFLPTLANNMFINQRFCVQIFFVRSVAEIFLPCLLSLTWIPQDGGTWLLECWRSVFDEKIGDGVPEAFCWLLEPSCKCWKCWTWRTWRVLWILTWQDYGRYDRTAYCIVSQAEVKVCSVY